MDISKESVTLRDGTASQFLYTHFYCRLQLPVSSTCTLDIFRKGSLNLTIVSSAVFLPFLVVFALIPLPLPLLIPSLLYSTSLLSISLSYMYLSSPFSLPSFPPFSPYSHLPLFSLSPFSTFPFFPHSFQVVLAGG